MADNPPTNQKKLSTGPIHIKPPSLPRGDHKTDILKPESENLADRNLEFEKQDSTKLDLIAENISMSQQSNQANYPASETSSQKQDFSKLDCQKVAMRLSTEAAEKLKQLRADTKLPYEVLVDVMIRNWDSLPISTQRDYLNQAKEVRAQRLIAGQLKTVASLRQKYEQGIMP
ncbi:MAG: hypothetical protein VKL42_07855 [Snowella sp.]|nr:hypothetical protein [Snowella sp.]